MNNFHEQIMDAREEAEQKKILISNFINKRIPLIIRATEQIGSEIASSVSLCFRIKRSKENGNFSYYFDIYKSIPLWKKILLNENEKSIANIEIRFVNQPNPNNFQLVIGNVFTLMYRSDIVDFQITDDEIIENIRNFLQERILWYVKNNPGV